MKRNLTVLFAAIFIVSVFAGSGLLADEISDMLKKLKSSDRVEMRVPTSVAAARGIAGRESLRNVAQTESMRASIRENIQSIAADEVKTAEFEVGKVCKDVHGNWVRLEEYLVIAPDGNANQFKLMILNERDDGARLDYFKNLSTFNKALPTDPAAFASVAKTMWSSGTEPDTYLKTVENLAANDYGDKVEWTHSNGEPVLNSTTKKYEPVFRDYSYEINDVPKYSYSGTAKDGSDRVWKVGDPATAAPINSQGDLVTAIGLTESATADNGTLFTSVIEGKTATETYYYINDDGQSTNPNTTDNWNQELIFGADEFAGRTIDLVISPDIFEQSGVGYLK